MSAITYALSRLDNAITDAEEALRDLNTELVENQPARESSPELSSLAAKYLGMNEWEYNGRMADLSLRFEFFTDIKRLAASVLSQDETKG